MKEHPKTVAMTPNRLLLLLPLLQAATSGRPQAKCAAGEGQELALTFAYATNATGHRRVEARLEHPLGGGGWQVRVEVAGAGAGCGRSLALTLLGPPAGRLRAPSPAPPPPPPGYTTLPGLGHYRAHQEALNWVSAHALCRREGGALAVPSSRREAEELLGRFPRNATGAQYTNYIWHGASDFEEEGKFVTEDGVPLEDTGFADFYPGEPTGGLNQNCIAIHEGRTLYDKPCSQKLPFICKVPL